MHHNDHQVFALPNTTIVQVSEVCSARGIWGGPEKPGYWIYGVAHGQIVCRVFRRLGHGYRVANDIPRDDPRQIPAPFDQVQNVLWKLFVGEGDGQYRVVSQASDVVSFWYGVKQLTYRLPLSDFSMPPERLGILGYLGSPKDARLCRVSVSADAEQWHPLTFGLPLGSVYEFAIPWKLKTVDALYVRVEGLAETVVAGYCLMG